MMQWADSWVLLLGFAVAALAVMRWWWGRILRRAQAASGLGHALLGRAVSPWRSRLRAALLWSGLLLCVIALAGPRWGGEMRQRSGRGAQVMVLLDCSRSMMAADMPPNRMEVARRKCIDLLRVAPHLRLGLMPFAAVPVLRCPPTGDQQVLEELLRDCSPDLFPASAGLQGTSIARSVEEALLVLARSREPGQAVLIVSDGADPDPAAVARSASAAKAAAVPVFGLFLGDQNSTAELRIDGTMQRMNADRSSIDQLATITAAVSVSATLDDRDVATLAAAIDRGVTSRTWDERSHNVAAERFYWILIPAMAAIFSAMLIPTRRSL